MARQARVAPHQRNWPLPPMNSTKWWKKWKPSFKVQKWINQRMLPLRIYNRLCLKVLQINRRLRQPWPASNGSWMDQRLSGQILWNEDSDHFPEVLKQVQPFLVGVLAYSDPSVSPNKFIHTSLANIHNFRRRLLFQKLNLARRWTAID